MDKATIKKVAKAHNTTLKEIAQAMEISEQALQYSLGRDMRASTIERIAQAIGCPVSELYGEQHQAHTSLTCPKCGAKFSIKVEGK